VVFPELLAVPEGQGRTLQLTLKPPTTSGARPGRELQLISFGASADVVQPTTHATGRAAALAERAPRPVELEPLRERCQEAAAVDQLYQAAARQQIELGPSFRWVEAVWHGADEALARLRKPEAAGGMGGYVLHPGLLDACLQLAAAMEGMLDPASTLLPYAVDELRVYRRASGREWWCHAWRLADRLWDVTLLEPDGQVVAEIAGFELRPAPALSIWGTELRHERLDTVPLRDMLLADEPVERERQLTAHLRDLAAAILGADPANLSAAQSLPELGLDSLMAAELGSRIKQSLGISLPTSSFISGLTLAELAAELDRALRAAPAAAEATPPAIAAQAPEPARAAANTPELLANLEQLSDAEVEALLASRLSGR
jgi:acyl carrier protein